jgi:hypothetical protein
MYTLREQWNEMNRKSWNPRQWFEDGDSPATDDTSQYELENKIMWVYRRSQKDYGFSSYEVGYYAPDKTWNSDSDGLTKEQAASRVHFLNGGRLGIIP